MEPSKLKIIGLTGPFGSGCTTAARFLERKLQAHRVSLSQLIRDTTATNPDLSREDLQRLGDSLREQLGPQVLASRAIQSISQEAELAVIECIKNTAEVRFLREWFGERFFLMAIMAREPVRWSRVEEDYERRGQGQDSFLEDDRRDRNEETPFGQAVALCVDLADILIANDRGIDVQEFQEKCLKYANVALEYEQHSPTSDEVAMHQAYSARHGTLCIKRRVGAAVVDPHGQIVGTGCNENPFGTPACVNEPLYNEQEHGPCLRDIVRNRHFRQLADTKATCPECGKPLGLVVGPPWYCPGCLAGGKKTDIETWYFPDRAMTYCTAVHAEVAALVAAGDRARGGTLYTTTFPCSPCSEQIVHCGIERVVFSESYADLAGRVRLEIADVALDQFEGVRSGAFERIYGRDPR